MTDYLTQMVNNDAAYKELKRKHLQAVKQNKDKFNFHNGTILVKFSHYWLQAIENQRERRGIPNAIYGKKVI